MLQGRGVISNLFHQRGLGAIYSQLLREASMLSFNDVFYLLSFMMMLILPLVLLMKKGKDDTPGAGMH
jgi:DHA2 family multidrug resistance protein